MEIMIIEYLEDDWVKFTYVTSPDDEWQNLLAFLGSNQVEIESITYPMHSVLVKCKSKYDVMLIKLKYGNKTPHGT
jgi:hypothetical protein